MKSVALVEIHVYQRMAPLVSGYLQAHAQADPVIKEAFSFRMITSSTSVLDGDEFTRSLIDAEADVYAFSCYVWNMGILRSVIGAVRSARPRADIILGGPQVMRHAREYLDPDDERMTVCNGEGEVTFTEYLRALYEGTDMAEVDGLSFFRRRELVTTPDRARIGSLDNIPSPYLSDIFEPGLTMGILETNRGCPFRCGFCFWGAATNDKVYRFDEQRVRDEITWMARNGYMFLHIADANWGMLGRDIDISQHIADCSRTYSAPNLLFFSSAKNKPAAASKIAKILADAGLVGSQPVSMQTLEPASLDIIKRSNIKLSAFTTVQESLREQGIGSFVELIWPLPGETLTSFQEGIGTLCDSGTPQLMIYPHLVLHNTPIYRDQDQLGLVTRPANSGVAEARIVVQTADVSEPEFEDGMRLVYAVMSVLNARGLHAVSRYLARTGQLRYADLYPAFVKFWKRQDQRDPIVAYVERSIRELDVYAIENTGLFVHLILHEQRRLFLDQVRRFAQSQPWWADRNVRALLEVDLVNRLYVYNNTPLDPVDEAAEAVRLIEQGKRAYTVEIEPEYRGLVAEYLGVEVPDGPFLIDHRQGQYPYMQGQDLVSTSLYCSGIVNRVEQLTPRWTAIAPAMS